MALSTQPDHLPRLDAGGNLHFQHALLAAAIIQTQACAAAAESGLQIDLHLGMYVTPSARARRVTTAGGCTAKQALEEITEIAVSGVTEIETLALPPVRRRTELLTRTIAACAQLIVGTAFLRITQHFVGFIHRLE